MYHVDYKLLIIEDNPATREILAFHLESSGFLVIPAENGQLGLESFFQEKPDLVLLDLRMPGMDGLEVLETITRKSSHTPVIIISGLGTTDDVIKALRLGAWDYITKPILDSRVLEHAVYKAIERRDLLLENRKYREGLEKEVRKRTAELEQRGSELEKAYFRLQKEIKVRQETEEALRSSEAKLRVLVNASAGPILLIDTDGTILDINESMAGELGSDATEIIGSCVWELYPTETINRRKALIEKVIKTGKPRFIEVERRGKWHDIDIYPIADSSNKVSKIAIFSRDITNHKWAEEKLREMSITDELTGLFNRRGILTLAQKQLKIAERTKSDLFLVYIDCDNMKWINDNLGHNIGDQALVETAVVLKETFREADVIGRLGGDEFVVVLTDQSGASDEQSVVKRLEEKMRQKNERDKGDYELSISTGTVRYDFNDPCPIEDLIARGDALMYECKMRKRKRPDGKLPIAQTRCSYCQKTQSTDPGWF